MDKTDCKTLMVSIFICLILFFTLGEFIANMNIANPTIISDSLWTEDCEIYHIQHKPNTKAHLSVSGEYDLFRRTNSHGFLDSEHEYKKQDNTIRIVLLGDSMFESRQVNLNESFYKLMDDLYREEGVNIEFINLGCSGYSPDLEYFRLINDGFEYDPDIAILGYFFNDVLDVNYEFSHGNKNYYKIANGTIVIDKAKWKGSSHRLPKRLIT